MTPGCVRRSGERRVRNSETLRRVSILLCAGRLPASLMWSLAWGRSPGFKPRAEPRAEPRAQLRCPGWA